MEWVESTIEAYTGLQVDWKLAAGGLAAAVVAATILGRALSPTKSVRGSIVVITGASSGIGRAAAKQLAVVEGATVIALARRSEKLKDLKDEVAREAGEGCIVPVSCDCSREEDVKRAVLAARSEQGTDKPVSAVINNAGTGLWKFLHELDGTAEVYSAMKAPVCASLVTTKLFLPLLAETAKDRATAVAKGGIFAALWSPAGAPPAPRILTVTSPASVLPFPGSTCYSIARRAMRGFTGGMRADLRGTGIEAQEVLLGEVSSSYWANNPGSKKNLPAITAILPTMTEQQAGAEVVAALTATSPGDVVAPWSIWALMWVNALMPTVFQAVLYSTAPSAKLDDIIASGKGSGASAGTDGRDRAGSRGGASKKQDQWICRSGSA